ncbi:MAG: hypothetical protein WDZ39_00815 [Candidatus Spechtbacterales bacterium]
MSDEHTRPETSEDEGTIPVGVATDPVPRSPFVKRGQLWLVGLLVFVLSLGSSVLLVDALDDDTGFQGVDVEGDMAEHVRRVRVEPKISYTPEEIKNVLKARTPGFAQADEDVQKEVEESWDEELAKLVNEEGLIPQDSLPQQLQMQPAEGFAVLVGDHAIVPSNLASQILNVPANVADRVEVTVTLHPDENLDDVDNWKFEELFRGSADEFLTNSNVQFDTDNNLINFKRPNTKEFADGGEFYSTASLDDVDDLSTVVFPGALGAVSLSEKGEVVGVVEDRDIILVRGSFTAPGTPVFLMRDSGELVFAGVFVGAVGNGVGAVISSDVVLDNLPEKGEEK